VEDDLPNPSANEVQVEVQFAGFSGADINLRRGVYPFQGQKVFVHGLSGAVGDALSTLANLQGADQSNMKIKTAGPTIPPGGKVKSVHEAQAEFKIDFEDGSSVTFGPCTSTTRRAAKWRLRVRDASSSI
jgi:hypothetical protein